MRACKQCYRLAADVDRQTRINDFSYWNERHEHGGVDMNDKIQPENVPPVQADPDLLVGREDRRTGLGVDALKRALLDKLVYQVFSYS